MKSEIPKGGVFKRLAKIFSIITGISIGSTFLLVLGLLAGVTLFVRTETFQRTFKNRIVEIVRGELDAEISFSSATVDVLSFSPSVSFEQIVFQPKNPELRTELKRFEVSISVFSLPLLAFNQLVIAEAVIDGLNYKISDFDALERWLDGLRPRDALVPIRLQTSVESISLIDAQLEVDLKKGKRWPLDTRGHFFVESFLVGLDADQTTLSGLVSFKDLQVAGVGPYEGQMMLDRADMTDSRLQFRNFKIVSGDEIIEFKGNLRDLGNPKLDLTGRVNLNLNKLVPEGKIDGFLDSTFRLVGPWQSLQGEGRIRSDGFLWGKKRFDRIESSWALDSRSVSLKELRMISGNELITGEVVVPFKATEDSKLSFNFRESDIGAYVGSLDETLINWRGSASGTFRYEGKLFPLAVGSVSTEVSISDFDIRSPSTNRSIFASPNLTIKAAGAINTEAQSDFNFQLDLGTGPWMGTARLTADRMDLNWTSKLNGNRIGTLFDYQLALKGDLPGTLSGEWSRLELLVRPRLEIFKLNNQIAKNLSGNLRYVNRRLLADPLTADEVKMSGGIYFPRGNKDFFENFKFSLNKIDLREFFGYLNFAPDEIWLAKGVLSGDGFLAGDLDQPRGAGTVLVEKWGFGERLARGYQASARWAWNKDEFYLADCSFLLGAKEGGITGEFLIDSKGMANVSFAGDKLRISDWLYLAGVDLNFQALADFRFAYQRDVPSLNASLVSLDSGVDGARGKSQFSINMTKDRLSADLSLFDSGLSANLKSSVSSGRQKTLVSLAMKDFNLSPWIGFMSASRLSAILRGSGELSSESKLKANESLLAGVASQWNQMSGVVNVEALEVRRTSLVLQQVEPFQMRIRPGKSSWLRFEADAISVISSDRLRLQLKGFYESLDAFELKVSGRTDLRAVSGLSPTLSRSEGILEAEGVLLPYGFSGRLSLSKGLVTFQDSPIIVRNVEADLRAERSDFEIQRLSGALREGTVEAKGRVRLTSRGVDSARLAVTLGNTLFQPQEGISFRASGPLELKVQGAEGEISGRLQIFDGLFRRRVDLRSDLVRVFKSKKIDFKSSDYQDMPWQKWRLRINVDSADPFNVRNNLAEGAANLRLVVGGTVQEMRLAGNVDLVRGQFAFNNRQFTVRSGSIVFQNPNTNVPNYDIRAETEIGDYRIFVKLFGGPDDQKISYSSDPILSEKDILSVISFGLPSSSDELKSQDPTRAMSLTGISFVTGQIQDQIEGRLSRDFGVQRFSLGPAFFEQTGRTELQLMVGTDLIRNKLGVNYSQFLSAEGGQRVELDLRMTRNFSLIGSWREVREEGKSTDDFGGDLRFRFEVE